MMHDARMRPNAKTGRISSREERRQTHKTAHEVRSRREKRERRSLDRMRGVRVRVSSWTGRVWREEVHLFLTYAGSKLISADRVEVIS